MKKIFAILLITVISFSFAACRSYEPIQNSVSTTENNKNKSNSTSSITFDGFEISLGLDVEVFVFEEKYSSHNGKDLIKIPFAIKNVKGESNSLNFWEIKFFGPDGIEIDDMNYNFDDSFKSEKMRNEAEINCFLYFLYNGDGDYYVEFNDFLNKEEIKISVIK